jgi:hypothetical protein
MKLICHKFGWFEEYVLEMRMDQYNEYLAFLNPSSETDKDGSVDEKRKKYGKYFSERKKTFTKIMGRAMNNMGEKRV